jgi:protein-S-isoprenylcysteine O-methyltransferase Ste14
VAQLDVLASTAFTIWARLKLGVMWNAAPTVKEHHVLQIGGPYRLTRHPIYTGILGMLLGSLLLAGAGRWIVAFPVLLVLFVIKIRIEERFMLAEFPMTTGNTGNGSLSSSLGCDCSGGATMTAA